MISQAGGETLTAATIHTLLSERILMTGITGIHGWPVFSLLASIMPQGQLFGIGPPRMKKPQGDGVLSCCITDREQLRLIKETFRPTMVIHAAGVCDLDVCEERPLWADKLNREGTVHIADLFGSDSALCFLSTDLVFSGDAPPCGGYTEEHTPDPVSVAGKTFFAAEKELIERVPEATIIRVGLPMGTSVTGDKGGLDWIEGRFKKGRQVTLFSDEYRSVIACEEVARCVLECVAAKERGILHLGGPQPVSLYELGQKVLRGGRYASTLLTSLLRHEEMDGPPRIGNVALNSGKIRNLLSAAPRGWDYSS